MTWRVFMLGMTCGVSLGAITMLATKGFDWTHVAVLIINIPCAWYWWKRPDKTENEK